MLLDAIKRTIGGGAGDAETPEIAILGAGAGGLCMAMSLRKAGIDSFTIYEKSDGVGGTWRDNTYPGAECDVKSHLYSFSFAPNPDWSRGFPLQPEILAYFERCAADYDLYPKIEFNTEITTLTFDEASGRWQLATAAGDDLEADVVVSGLGQLNRPTIPDFVGLDSFEGTTFHSARWNHDHDLEGERVAVIGNAASALQFIPEIAPVAGEVDVYQRTPNWVLPKPNRTYTDLQKLLFRYVPGVIEAHRAWIYWSFEIRYPAFRADSRLARAMEMICSKYLQARVQDPDLRETLTPDYPIGAKRVLASNYYYKALMRDDVDLITDPIEKFVPDGVVTADGTVHQADTVIFATGFDSTHFLAPLDVVGRDGACLQDAWHDGAEAYLGMTVAGFPNLFMLYGPNTNLGHNSILFMIERQVDYIIRCIAELGEGDGAWLDVKPEAQQRYNTWVQDCLKEMAWEHVDRSWYKHESGKGTNNWPRTTLRYWFDTLQPRFGNFERGHADAARERKREPKSAGAAV